jgi:abortive infection bacteriophage resistance protein
MADTDVTSHHEAMLTAAEQVGHLASEGVAFVRCPPDAAADYLAHKNTLFRMNAYLNVFPRHDAGKMQGRFIDVDFADVIELAAIDQQLRNLFLPMTLQIEHFAKVTLLAEASKQGEDGYAVMDSFNRLTTPTYQKYLAHGLDDEAIDESPTWDIYPGNLAERYGSDIPLWAMLEVASLGDFLSLYLFCAGRWRDDDMAANHPLLKQVKDLRNSCAHGNCLVNCFVPGQVSKEATSDIVRQALAAVGIHATESRSAKLANPRMQQLATTAVAFVRIVENDHARDRARDAADALAGRMAAFDAGFGAEVPLVSYLSFLGGMLKALL